MPYIEGLGDEVVLVLGGFLVLILIILVWISTSVNERIPMNVILVERARFQLLRRLGLVYRLRNGRMERVPVRGAQARQADQATAQVAQEVRAQPNQEEDVGQTSTPLGAESTHSNVESVQPVVESEQPVVESEQSSNGVQNGQKTSTESAESSLDLQESDSASHASHGGQSSSDITSSRDDTPPTLGQTEAREGDVATMRQLRVAFLERQSLGKSGANVLTQTGVESADVTVTSQIQSEGPERLPATTGSDKPETDQSEPSPSVRSPPAQESTPCEDKNPADLNERLEGHIRVKLRYMNERQTVVQARPEDTLQQFKRRHFAAELADNLRVRLIYNGQELRNEGRSLDSYNILDNSVVHCLLTNVHLQQQQQASQPVNAQAPQEFDIGNLVFPLFGFMLVLIWYCRVEYKQYFNAVSTMSLIGITFLYVVAFLASRRNAHRENMHEHQD